MRATLQDVKEGLRRRMHQPIPTQGRWLRKVVRGYHACQAVPTNFRAISAFRYHVVNLWRRTLKRRSQRGGMTWERIGQIAKNWLPMPEILHPWSCKRFVERYPRWERGA